MWVICNFLCEVVWLGFLKFNWPKQREKAPCMVTAPSYYTGLCACHRLLSLNPTGLESGILLLYFSIGCSEVWIAECPTNLLKEPFLNLQRNGGYWWFLNRRELFNAVNSQCICIPCMFALKVWTQVSYSPQTPFAVYLISVNYQRLPGEIR